MHNTAISHYGFDLSYTALEVPETDLVHLPKVLNHKKFVGSNVTIPHKQTACDFVDERDQIVQSIGALNTIYKSGEKLAGTNTDVYGFTLPLEKYREDIIGNNAVVFGTGGASRSIVYALGNLGVETIYLVSRNPEKMDASQFYSESDLQVISYDAWPHFIDEIALLVNASPVGMVPLENHSPVSAADSGLLEGKICYDIVCKPVRTKFLTLAEKAGGIIIEGIDMLIYQGSESFKVWTGKPFPVDLVRSKLTEEIYG